MGKPTAGNAAVRYAEYIGETEQTPGSETSQYREEKKENSIPLVVASERGTAQYNLAQTLIEQFGNADHRR